MERNEHLLLTVTDAGILALRLWTKEQILPGPYKLSLGSDGTLWGPVCLAFFSTSTPTLQLFQKSLNVVLWIKGSKYVEYEKWVYYLISSSICFFFFFFPSSYFLVPFSEFPLIKSSEYIKWYTCVYVYLPISPWKIIMQFNFWSYLGM